MAGSARRQSGGSIRRMKSGRWRVRVRERATGGYVTLGMYATKADAEAALTGAKADVQRDGLVAPERGRVILAEYADRWFEHHPTRAPRTGSCIAPCWTSTCSPTWVPRRLVTSSLRPSSAGTAGSGSSRRWASGPRTTGWSTTILNHAVKDQRIVCNPCMLDRGGQETSPKWPVATIPQVFALADAMPERLSAMILVAGFGSLRAGEVAGLQRGDVDVEAGRIRVARQVPRLNDGTLLVTAPMAGSSRTVTLPEQVVAILADHLDHHTGPDPEDHVFTRQLGTPMHHRYVNRCWRDARAVVVAADPTLPAGLRFHDLRGTGATLATAEGASLKEVRNRLGHRRTQAALIYQHATEDRDKAIAALLGRAIDQARR